jgi:hypothetical protein
MPIHLGAERHGPGQDPRGERRPGYGRQCPVGTDAEGRDVACEPVSHVDEPAKEVHPHGIGSVPGGEGRLGDGR